MTAADVTRFVNSRAMVALAGVIMLVAARVAFQLGEVTYIQGSGGLLFPSAGTWIEDHWLSMAVNTGSLLCIALGWILIIQVFNPFRALTTLQASMFLVMCTATPDILDQLSSGTLLAAAVVACTALMWSSFANPWSTRHIFLAFAILSALSTIQYCFVFYIPVYIAGCAQMKIFNPRTLLACLLGIVTPWWIILGMGWADLSMVHVPSLVNFFTSFSFDDTLHFVTVALITAALLLGTWGANVMKVLTLNSNLRAFNGNLSLLALVTIIAMVADFTNAASYLPTLYLLTSYQFAYTIATSAGRRRFIPVLLVMALYVGLYVSKILI